MSNKVTKPANYVAIPLSNGFKIYIHDNKDRESLQEHYSKFVGEFSKRAAATVRPSAKNQLVRHYIRRQREKSGV